jgi:hypothetical protein
VAGREHHFGALRKAPPHRVIVVGGGPGGMEAARVAHLAAVAEAASDLTRRLGGDLDHRIQHPQHPTELGAGRLIGLGLGSPTGSATLLPRLPVQRPGARRGTSQSLGGGSPIAGALDDTPTARFDARAPRRLSFGSGSIATAHAPEE